MASKRRSPAAAPKAKPSLKAKAAPNAKAAPKTKSAAKPKAAPKAKAAVKPKTKATTTTKAQSAAKATRTTSAKPKSDSAPAKKPAAQVAELASSLGVGNKAPSFRLTDEKGAEVSSSSLAGKPYLLYFYPKDDTPGCTKEACDIRDNFGRFGERGLRVLGVSPDSSQSHAKFGQKYGLPFTLLSDPDKTLAKAYAVWGEKNNYGKKYMGIIRSSFLVGADGRIKKEYRGVKVNGHVDEVLTDAGTLL